MEDGESSLDPFLLTLFEKSTKNSTQDTQQQTCPKHP